MVEWNVDLVRSIFVDYFRNNKQFPHAFVPSSSVVPYNDPTLLFANAGMNQFKDIFLGTVDPDSELGKLAMVANSQKCIRAGGKHNDLEDVGKDGYHHTFFEMLGNWSFGKYFKREAIEMAWDCLNNVYGLDKNRLYVTYFSGDKDAGIDADLETRDIWLDILPRERVLPFGVKDNFWEMGDTGPCGPCSEIHYCRDELLSPSDPKGAELVNKDDHRVIELWNLVFIQYNRDHEGKLNLLPKFSIDTGMGLERVVSVLQNVYSNYDTDVFEPLFDKIYELCNNRPGMHRYTGKFGEEDIENVDKAYRVVGDHIRTIVVSISDGCIPSNEGRGYVIRRVLRRALRYAYDVFGAEPGFLSELVPTVSTSLSYYTKIASELDKIKGIISYEESLFRESFYKGMQKFREYIGSKDVLESKKLHGDKVWKLYDTYGFPVDLTKMMLRENGLKTDDSEIEKAMEESRLLSKRSSNKSNRQSSMVYIDTKDGLKTIGFENNTNSNPLNHSLNTYRIEYLRNNGYKTTDDSFKYNDEYVSLDNHKNLRASLLCVFGINESDMPSEPISVSNIESISGESLFVLVFDRTCFYSESGGQSSDFGKIYNEENIFLVLDVKMYGGYVAHIGVFEQLKHKDVVGTSFWMEIDVKRRHYLTINHTATHVLNFSLAKVLGQEGHRPIEQKGSSIYTDRFRFDFSYDGSLNEESLKAIEDASNQMILGRHDIYSQEMLLEESKKITGLRTLPGENYPNTVKVVSIGIPTNMLFDNTEFVSVELCGGTHLKNTEHIGRFIIVSEASISKGTRRIVAITGDQAEKSLSESRLLWEELKETESMFYKDDHINISKKIKDLFERISAGDISVLEKISLKRGLKELSIKYEKMVKDNSVKQLKMVEERLSSLSLNTGNCFLIIENVKNAVCYKSLIKTENVVRKGMKNLEYVSVLFCIEEDTLDTYVVVGMNGHSILGSVTSKTIMNEISCVFESFGHGGKKDELSQGYGKLKEGVHKDCSLKSLLERILVCFFRNLSVEPEICGF